MVGLDPLIKLLIRNSLVLEHFFFFLFCFRATHKGVLITIEKHCISSPDECLDSGYVIINRLSLNGSAY